MRPLFLGTPLSDALSTEGVATVAFLRSDEAEREKSERAFRFIYAVGEHTLAYHFTEPLERLGVGGVMRKTVSVALHVALAGLRRPLHHVLGGMDDAQLRRVAEEIEFRLYPDPHAG